MSNLEQKFAKKLQIPQFVAGALASSTSEVSSNPNSELDQEETRENPLPNSQFPLIQPLASFNITTTTDGGIGSGSLREAVIQANANGEDDTILLSAGNFNLTLEGSNEDAAATGDLDITAGTITIRGAGIEQTIIDANKIDRVFDVFTGASLVLEDLTITGGLAVNSPGGRGRGGGVYVGGGNLTLKNVKVFENEAEEEGGGIYVDEGNLSLENVDVLNNEAVSSLGKGGGISVFRSNLNITNSNISNNLAKKDGGGLHLNRTSGTITNSIFSFNTAEEGDGGGILHRNDGDLTLANSSVLNNSADDEGGGIQNFAMLTVTESLIKDNSARSGGGIRNDGADGIATIIGSQVTENTAGSFGGGISNNHGRSIIISTTVAQNEASMDGGGIRNGGTGNAELTLINSTINDNFARGSGGGLAQTTLVVGADILNSTFTNNRALSDGGGISNKGSDDEVILLKNTIVLGNSDEGGAAPISNDVDGFIVGNANNLVGDVTGAFGSIGTGTDLVGVDPLLGPLQDNGGPLIGSSLDNGESGPTLTHALALNSPAINAGDNSELPEDTFDLDDDGNTTEPIPFDQRGMGFDRLVNGAVDIGAFEFADIVVTVPVNLSIIPTAGTEEAGTEFTITVTADSAVTGDQTVNLALSGDAEANDFTAAIPSQITILNGETTGSVKVKVNDDGDDEADLETATFIISNPSSGLTLGTITSVDVTIEDNDPAVLTTVVNFGTLSNDQLNLPDSTNKKLVFAGVGNDKIDASEANTPQFDRLYGGSDNDNLFAGQSDRLFGGSGDDVLDARKGTGNNRLFGGTEADELFANSNDFLIGGDGNDTLNGGAGDNLMIGGTGADIFVIQNTDDGTVPQANTIFDFEEGIDQIDVTSLVINGQSISPDDLVIAPDGGKTTISFNEKVLFILIGDNFDINAEDFV